MCIKSLVKLIGFVTLQATAEPWEAKDDHLITLCEDCHYIVTAAGIELSVDLNATIYKRPINDLIYFFAIHSIGISIYRKNIITSEFIDLIHISHTTASPLLQYIINYWMATESEHLLIDKSIPV